MRTSAERGPEDSAADATGASRVDEAGPYRDARDVLLAKRRRVRASLEWAERAAEQADLLRQELEHVDSALRESATSVLARVRIATPCRERWEDMAGDDVVRHCRRCDQDVYDLASMTTAEAEALLASARAGEGPCVRLRRRRDGRVVTADCPPPSWVERARARAAGATAAALASGALVAVALPSGDSALAGSDEAPAGSASLPFDTLVEYLRGQTVTMGAIAPAPSFEVSEAALAIAWPGTTRMSSALAKDGSAGVQVFGVHDVSVLASMGLQDGDIMLQVGGRPVHTSSDAVDALAALRTRGHTSIVFERAGHVYEHLVLLARGDQVPRRPY